MQYSAPSGLGLGLIVAYQGRRALRLPLAFIFRAFGAAYPGGTLKLLLAALVRA